MIRRSPQAKAAGRRASILQQPAGSKPPPLQGDGLSKLLGLSRIIVRAALDHMEGLVRAGRGPMDHAGMRLRHRIVGTVLDRKKRRPDMSSACQAVSEGILDRPLRQPGSEGRETTE